MTYWKFKTAMSSGDEYESDESLHKYLSDIKNAMQVTYDQMYGVIGMDIDEWNYFETYEYEVVL